MSFSSAGTNASNAANHAQSDQAIRYLAQAVVDMARALQQMEADIKRQLAQIQQNQP